MHSRSKGLSVWVVDMTFLKIFLRIFLIFQGILDQVEFYSRIELYRYGENIYLVPRLGNCSHIPLNDKFCMSDLFDDSIFSSQAFEILSSNHIFKYSCILLKIISVMEV